MKIVVIDGQGGRIGAALVERFRRAFPTDELIAVGTNSAATAAMLKMCIRDRAFALWVKRKSSRQYSYFL